MVSVGLSAEVTRNPWPWIFTATSPWARHTRSGTRASSLGAGMTVRGRGVALVPASVAKLSLKGVVYRPLRAPKRRAELWLVKRREDHRPAVATLMELLAKAAA